MPQRKKPVPLPSGAWRLRHSPHVFVFVAGLFLPSTHGSRSISGPAIPSGKFSVYVGDSWPLSPFSASPPTTSCFKPPPFPRAPSKSLESASRRGSPASTLHDHRCPCESSSLLYLPPGSPGEHHITVRVEEADDLGPRTSVRTLTRPATLTCFSGHLVLPLSMVTTPHSADLTPYSSDGSSVAALYHTL